MTLVIPKISLTECHDQAGIGSEVDNLLDGFSGWSVESDEDSQDRSKTADKDEREDGEPAATYQDTQLPPLGVVERIVRVARRDGNSSNFSDGVDELEIAIRGLLFI